MKKLIVLLIILFSITAFGAEIDDLILDFNASVNSQGFAWDANSEPDLAGYKIYRSSISNNYSTPAHIIIIPLTAEGFDPSNPSYIENDIPDGTWFWVATAYDIYDNESVYSNELTKTFGGNLPSVPQGLRIERTP